MMKRRSFILMLAVGVFVLYAVMNYFQQRALLRDDFQKRILHRERDLNAYAHLMKKLGSQELWDDAHDELNNAVKIDFIDFFLLTYQGTPVWYGSQRNDFDPAHFQTGVLNQMMISKTATYETLSYGNDYQLTIGITKDLNAWLKTYMQIYYKSMEQEAILYMLIVLGVSLYLFRDFFKIIRSVREGRVEDIATMKSTSAESELFVRGFSGFVQNQNRLETENAALLHQVLPSLQKEIFSGRKPPYDFQCTLVRTDINNFSHIYNTQNVDQFMALINEFFIEVSEIVSRYQGLVHEFVGDEVLYFFKDDDHGNSFLTAMSAIRDVNAAAARFNDRAQKNFGYPFTVKSSLAHGTLRFGPLVNGFSLAGGILIETVRILAHVNEKSGNVIYFDSRHVPSLEPLAHSHEALRTQLKGLSGQRTLYTYDRHDRLHDVLSQLSIATIGQLAYFRSDEHLNEILAYLKKNYVSMPVALVLRVCQELRKVHRSRIGDGFVIQALLDWIDDLETSCVTSAAQPWKILSSALMLTINFISREEFTPEIQEHLERFTHSPNKRVAANVLEALMHLRSHHEKADVELFEADENNRLSTNALIFQARKQIDAALIAKLRARLKSKENVTVAGGLYALGEIGAYHKQRDPVAFEMQIEFLSLFKTALELTAHDDESVRYQATRAIEKLGVPANTLKVA